MFAQSRDVHVPPFFVEPPFKLLMLGAVVVVGIAILFSRRPAGRKNDIPPN